MCVHNKQYIDRCCIDYNIFVQVVVKCIDCCHYKVSFVIIIFNNNNNHYISNRNSDNANQIKETKLISSC